MPTATSLPGPLRLTPSFPFVGRARELATLRALVPQLDGEGRRAALIGGEAGSGKSRLVRELAREAAGEGALVLYGACDPAVHTPYRPFVEALDWLVRSSDPDTLRADLGTTGGELARLLPDLPERIDGLVLPVDADADTERHRLHTAVTELLAAVGRRRPLVLLLEDGHWADSSTLLLLRHLAGSAADVRMLLVATFRDTDADVPAELADTLADLRRSEDVLRLRLVGLTPEEISEFVAGAAGGSGSEPALAQAIGELTGGNAFLLCELWRMLVETGAVAVEAGQVRVLRPVDTLATPESVREVVAQRLSRLDPATRDTLELAAVAGPQFDFDVLARASTLTPAGHRRALDEAERSGMIEEVPGAGLTFRFTHELVRRTVATRLTGLRRAELHLAIGEALEESRQPPTDRVLADLAHHFAGAVPLGDPVRAVDYNLRAAATAAAALAFEEAVARYRTALEVGIPDERRRIATLLELGTAEYRGGSLRSLVSFRTAADIAREIDDPVMLAEAAMGFENACWRPGVVDAGARELLEEASALLPPDDSTLRVRLLAGLARSLDFQGEHARAKVTRSGAVAMARRLDDRLGLATVLSRAYWGRGAESLAAIVEMLFEAQAIAEELGDLEIESEARQWRIAALIGHGQLDAARRELSAVLHRAKRTRQPFILHASELFGSAIALADGHLAEAEVAAARSYEWSRLLTGRDASGGYGIQMFGLRREQGRLAELAPVVRVLATRGASGDGAWRPARAAMFAELGMERECRAELAHVRAAGLDALRDSSPWLASLTYLADAAVAVADEATAGLVYPELLDNAGTNVMIGIGVASYGSADRYLGMLAGVLGDAGAAERHLETAMAFNRRMGATTWVAHTAYEHARVLLAAGDRERASRAAALLREASALAARVGLPTLQARILALEGPVRAEVPLPDGLSAREVEILVRVARGLSNREIGAELVISEHTAASHVRSILRKTGCSNRTEAASYAHTNGLAESP